MLSIRDLKALSALSKFPLGTIKSLSRIAGTSSNTLSRRLKRLKRKGVLISVSAEICYPSLGLEPIIFFFNAPFKHLEVLEMLLDIHPYSRYRVRCLGFCNGIYTLFAIPQGTFPLLMEFIDELVQRGLITEYHYEETIARWVYSENDFSYYDPKSDSWRFDWSGWDSLIEKTVAPPPLRRNPPSVLHLMDERDMRILRQLTIDAREKKSVMAERAGVPAYHLSRRIRFYMKKNVIDAFRVIVHRDASKLLATLLFDCRCPIRVTERFAEALTHLPFQSTLIPVKEGFLLQTSIPPIDLPKLGTILQKYCDELRVVWSDYDSSMRYWFWTEPYRDGEWISTREYMVTDVLKVLKEGSTVKKAIGKKGAE